MVYIIYCNIAFFLKYFNSYIHELFFLKNEMVMAYFYNTQKIKLNIIFIVSVIGKTAFLFEITAI